MKIKIAVVVFLGVIVLSLMATSLISTVIAQTPNMLTQISYIENGVEHFIYLSPPDGPVIEVFNVDPTQSWLAFTELNGTTTLGFALSTGENIRIGFLPDNGSWQVKEVPNLFP